MVTASTNHCSLQRVGLGLLVNPTHGLVSMVVTGCHYLMHMFSIACSKRFLIPFQTQTLFSLLFCLGARKSLTCFMWYFVVVSQPELPLGLGQIFSIFRRTDLFMMLRLSIIFHLLHILPYFLNEIIIFFPATKTGFLTAVISRSNCFFSIAILSKLLYFFCYVH